MGPINRHFLVNYRPLLNSIARSALILWIRGEGIKMLCCVIEWLMIPTSKLIRTGIAKLRLQSANTGLMIRTLGGGGLLGGS